MAITASSALRGGLAGASVLSVLHEIFKKVDKHTPRQESLGINTIAKAVKVINGNSVTHQKLVHLPLVGELIANTLYFSLAGLGSKKNLLMRSALLGLTAGLGTLVLPQHLGLTESVDQPMKTKVTTIAGIFIGSLIAAAAIKAIQKREKKVKVI